MTDVDVAREVAAYGDALGPRLRELGEAIAPEVEHTFWPDGAPGVITWATLLERQLELLRDSTDALVRHDVELAEQRDQPWPSGASIRSETALRVAEVDELLREARELVAEGCQADLIVFAGEAPAAPLSIAALFDRSATAMEALAVAVREEASPLSAALPLGVLIEEVTRLSSGVLQVCGRHEGAAAFQALLPDIGELLHRLELEHEALAMVAALLPPGGTGAQSADRATRIGAELRRVATLLAVAVDGEVFGGAPPPLVSFLAIRETADARRYGDEVPSELGRLRTIASAADGQLIAADDEALATVELLDRAAESVETTAAKVRALPPDGLEQMGPVIELRARVLALAVVQAAGCAGRGELVAELARTLGLGV